MAARWAKAAAVAGLLLPGCTWIATFDEVGLPLCGDGGACQENDEAGPPSRADAAPADAAPADASPPRDAGDPNSRACIRKDGTSFSGYACAKNLDSTFTGSPDTLLVCDAGKLTRTYLCSDCLVHALGEADTCDDCVNKADGAYCGSELATWKLTAGTSAYLLTCSNGHLVTGSARKCANGCVHTAGTTAKCR